MLDTNPLAGDVSSEASASQNTKTNPLVDVKSEEAISVEAQPVAPAKLSLESLLASGAHFGHKASRWNPKMAPYIFTTRNKFHIIDLEKTHERIKRAQEFISEVTKKGGIVLFVGTKRQAKNIVKKHATAAGMPYVSERWLGGTLTNFKTIQRSIRKMKDIEELLASDRAKTFTKKEQLMMQREYNKSMILFEGIRKLKQMPEAVFIVDTDEEKIAVREARNAGVKIIGLSDTNSDPTQIDYLIPANDDAAKTIELITAVLAQAVRTPVAGESVASAKQSQARN